MDSPELTQLADGYRLGFRAMASPCEVRIDTLDRNLAAHMGNVVETEARRIEHKFSRYRDDSIIARINQSNGEVVEVDDELVLELA